MTFWNGFMTITLVHLLAAASPGPDFVLVVYVVDMAAYHAFAHRALSAQANVRNVRSFFSVHRSKFAPAIPA